MSQIEVLRGANYRLALAPPEWLAIKADHYPGESPRVFKPFVASTVAKRSQYRVVIDGTMLDALDNPDNAHGNDIYRSYTKAGMLSQVYDPSHGVDYEGHQRWRNFGKTISLVGSSLVVTPTQQRPADARVSVQLYPYMVHAGRNIYPLYEGEPTREWRAGVGVHRDGRLAFLAWVGGIYEGAEIAVSLGLTEFGYTDGGGSTALWVDGEQIAGPSRERRLGSVIVARERPVIECVIAAVLSLCTIPAALYVIRKQ